MIGHLIQPTMIRLAMHPTHQRNQQNPLHSTRTITTVQAKAAAQAVLVLVAHAQAVLVLVALLVHPAEAVAAPKKETCNS